MFTWLKELFTSPDPAPVRNPKAVVTHKPLPVEAPDSFYSFRPIFDLLGLSEGTDKGDGYNETLSYGAMLDGVRTRGKGLDITLTDKTLSEIDAIQTKMLKDPDNTWNSSAIGRYQIVRTTLRVIRKELGLPLDTKFSKMVQDLMALHLLKGRGLSSFLAGTLTEDAFMNALAREWASIPTTKGTGYYSNQKKTPVTPEQVRTVLREVLRRVKG
jgi:muramidase (phage lysozyme)